MISLDRAAAIALALPEVGEAERHGHRCWQVAGRMFAWERPFSKADVKRFGEVTPPDGDILAVAVGDLAEKEAVLAANPTGFFTIPHFDGYAAVLVHLRKAPTRAVREVLSDGWLACAPTSLVEQYLAARRRR